MYLVLMFYGNRSSNWIFQEIADDIINAITGAVGEKDKNKHPDAPSYERFPCVSCITCSRNTSALPKQIPGIPKN